MWLMSLRIPLPTGEVLLEAAVFDVNGTLTDRGRLLGGVVERMSQLGTVLRIQLVSSDTYGTLDDVAAELGLDARRVQDGTEKVSVLHSLGADTCVAVGNGHNDRLVLAEAALGIAVLGPEGSAQTALASADLVCPSILVALDLLLDPTALAATLRG
jgi:soluble P-type ATPase